MNYIILFILTFFVVGCRNEPPTNYEVEKRLIQYYNSLNQPFEISDITINPQLKKRFYSIDIHFRANIYSPNKERIIHSLNNSYKSEFRHLAYGYWLGKFSLNRYPPPDSVIYNLSSDYFNIAEEQISIVNINQVETEQHFYPVIISLKRNFSDSTYTLPFHQDEFGLWHLGISKLITPESTVKSFLAEVNKGNTDKARRYFSYEFKLGYDEWDKKNLEELFPEGSIKDILVSDVAAQNDTAHLNLTVVKTDLDTFKTNLEFIKTGIEWRFNYNGWDWKFKPSDSNKMSSIQ